MSARAAVVRWLCGWVLALGCACGAAAAATTEPGGDLAEDPPSAVIESVAAAEVLAPPWTRGKASWYSHRFVGKRTASGEPYRKEVFSAAHRRLPLGALVTVRNPANQREVVVRVNDRGPRHPQRDIDLSHAAAQTLGVAHHGVATVEWQLAPAGARVTAPLPTPKATKAKSKPRYPAVKPRQPRR